MSEIEKKRALVQARSELAKAMSTLHHIKAHFDKSGWKQIAEVIVSITELRQKLEHIDT